MDDSTQEVSTSQLARIAAEKKIPSRRQKIGDLLTSQPRTIWEIALALGVHEHQISGRFSEMESDGLIVKTGLRRRNPRTGCDAEVYDIIRQEPMLPFGR